MEVMLRQLHLAMMDRGEREMGGNPKPSLTNEPVEEVRMAEIFDIPDSVISPVLSKDMKVQYAEHGEISYPAKLLNRSQILPERVLNICGNKKSMVDAMVLSSKLSSSFPEVLNACVYVISADNLSATKIGVSRNPAQRIVSLQTSSPYKLDPHYLFWMPLAQCYGIESLSHRIASQLGVALNGEWVKGRAEVAGMIVASVITETNVQVCSSGMHIENTNAMLDCIKNLTGERPSYGYKKTHWEKMFRCDPTTI